MNQHTSISFQMQNTMTSLENLHYGIGQAAYAMARIDGKVQREERQKFHDIVAGELGNGHPDFNISKIIFTVLDEEKMDAETAYAWAMKDIRLNSHYLSPELKLTALRIVEKIAQAFPPVNDEERSLLHRFRADIAPLQGDPVYYS
jgi:hypothetical protein